MQSYIFLGPPASGKGTQAKDLAEKLGLVYFGTGDLLRAEGLLPTERGKIVHDCVSHGKLVPMSMALDILGDFFAKNKNKKYFLYFSITFYFIY